MLKVITILIVILCSFQVELTAQNNGLRLEGEITDEAGNPLSDCFVRINQIGIAATLFFTQTGSKNRFSISLKVPGKDSVILTVGRLGYENFSQAFSLESAQDLPSFQIKLARSPVTLEEVKVQPSQWSVGDTTYFKVDSFKQGTEKKLIDLIQNIPFFRIDNNGALTYKDRTVSKILVEGQDILADKTSVLLNSFPVHVLNTLDVRENQSGNPLLKGLEQGSQIFLNLGIKKSKINMAFGDFDVGIGTHGKYLLNPVLFGLYQKVKFGFLAGYNNVGNGIGFMQENELKNDATRLADNWMMNAGFLNEINDFDNRHYINNQMWDNRLKLNIDGHSPVKTEWELNYLHDRQLQNVNSSILYFSDSFPSNQSLITHFKRVPDILLAKEKTTWKISDNKELVAGLSGYFNNSAGVQSNFLEQNFEKDTSINRLQNHFNNLTAALKYTHRINEIRGVVFEGAFSRVDNRQRSLAYSHSWPILFDLSNQVFDEMNIHLNDLSTLFTGSLQFSTKKKKGLITNIFNFSAFTSKVATGTYFSQSKGIVNDTTIVSLQGMGKYASYEANGTARKGFSFWKRNYSASLDYGLSWNHREEEHTRNDVKPFFKLLLEQRIAPSRKIFSGGFKADFSSQIQEQYQQSGLLLPVGFNSFRKGWNGTESLQNMNLMYLARINTRKTGLRTFFAVSYRRDFNSYAYLFSKDRLIQYTTDTIIRRSRNGITTNINLAATYGGIDFRFYGGWFFQEQFFNNYSLGVIKGNLVNSSGNLTVTKKWDKKVILKLMGNYSSRKVNYPDLHGKFISSGFSTNMKWGLYQYYFLSPQVKISLNSEAFYFSAPQHAYQFYFLESGCDISIPKMPVSFNLKFQNILNLSELKNFYANSFYQSTETISINPRNLFLGIRCEF